MLFWVQTCQSPVSLPYSSLKVKKNKNKNKKVTILRFYCFQRPYRFSKLDGIQSNYHKHINMAKKSVYWRLLIDYRGLPIVFYCPLSTSWNFWRATWTPWSDSVLNFGCRLSLSLSLSLKVATVTWGIEWSRDTTISSHLHLAR